MNQYEAVFILNPDLQESDLEKAVHAATSMITKEGGEVKKEESWGKKTMTFRLKKHNEGVYHRVEFDIEPGKISALKREFGLNDNILRVMIVRKEA